jgi:ATP-dependent Lon protease
MQATKGNGRIIPLGSMQRVMKESVEAAAQYIRAKHGDLGITTEWRQSFDIAVLATFMGIPKEGPSAGITIVTGIVSALTGRRVRNDLAMTGARESFGPERNAVTQRVSGCYCASARGERLWRIRSIV